MGAAAVLPLRPRQWRDAAATHGSTTGSHPMQPLLYTSTTTVACAGHISLILLPLGSLLVAHISHHLSDTLSR